MKSVRLVLPLALATVLGVPAAAQDRWRLAVTAGPLRVDRLAGTPLVPAAALSRPVGRRAVFAGSLGWVRDAGFYGLDAVNLDLGVGIRFAGRRTELAATAGPTAMLGGDGDGTPYTSVGGQATLAGVRWLGNRIGITASVTGRLWFTTGNSRFSPGAAGGIVLGL